MKNFKIIIFSFLMYLILISLNLFGQNVSIIPKINITSIHGFLQKNADSTILFEYDKSWGDPPEYFILSKSGDTLTTYFYKSFYKSKINMPRAIRDSLYKINKYYESKNIGINRFFIPKYLSDNDLLVFWQSLLKQKPWQINDDLIDGESCPNAKNGYDKNIYDGGGISLYLVTKNNIKRLYFYAPRYYEKEVCPGRKGRQAILEIENLFKTHFKDEW
ncbi:hypothetical protein GJU39_11165 [Pedobacter petrophilus]|uniref:Uncharacterized protein n=1 Tax=Pedobacter petrophilus TaxID=1908241 RepID=A0A7K0FZ53_9SPHI|nr:hypothetical protein [Pedobacter petrophilus]MRX76652.1 hypothetical protein [Pedobacter petrophilus]